MLTGIEREEQKLLAARQRRFLRDPEMGAVLDRIGQNHLEVQRAAKDLVIAGTFTATSIGALALVGALSVPAETTILLDPVVISAPAPDGYRLPSPVFIPGDMTEINPPFGHYLPPGTTTSPTEHPGTELGKQPFPYGVQTEGDLLGAIDVQPRINF